MQVLPSLFAYSLNIHVHISSAQAERSSGILPEAPGGGGQGVRGAEDEESLSSISPFLWSPEPLAKGLILSWFFNNFT